MSVRSAEMVLITMKHTSAFVSLEAHSDGVGEKFSYFKIKSAKVGKILKMNSETA